MKCFMLLMIFATFMTGSAFATETNTDCPMMRESNERNNPKANLNAIKSKAKKTKSGATAG